MILINVFLLQIRGQIRELMVEVRRARGDLGLGDVGVACLSAQSVGGMMCIYRAETQRKGGQGNARHATKN